MRWVGPCLPFVYVRPRTDPDYQTTLRLLALSTTCTTAVQTAVFVSLSPQVESGTAVHYHRRLTHSSCMIVSAIQNYTKRVQT